jgi:phage terminase large subunit GpA-like protein
VPCPHCGHEQPLVWSGLHWTPDGRECWYVCRECGAVIGEHDKPSMIARGRWVPENPGAKIRGYQANCLYYPIGLGPRWLDLVGLWRAAQHDPTKLQVFVQERLAESWEDPKMRAVKHRTIADRAEQLPLRPVPPWVLAVTAGIDTQDDRLAAQLVGWGIGLRCWPIDYVELPGDPADEAVFTALVDLLLRPIESSLGGQLRVEAAAIDIMGHRTEAVKAFVRRGVVRRLLAIFGAVPNNAPVLGKGKLQDINWRGQLDKRGVHIHAVGTVGIKHLLYSRLSADGDKALEDRWLRFSDELPDEYFGGLTAEVYNPVKNRFEKRRGAPRNEPLDTWVYAYAATHHPELRLHRRTRAEWDAVEARLRNSGPQEPAPATTVSPIQQNPNVANVPRGTPASADAFGSSEWSGRL